MAPSAHHPAPEPASGAAGADGQAREVEWQLAAPDLAAVQHWLLEHPVLEDLRIEPLPIQQLHDTYLDTGDWRVLRSGFALRLRAKEGQVEATLKGLHSAREDVADRREISEPLRESGIKGLAHATGPVGSRVRDVVGTEPLRTLFEIRTSRQRFAVRRRAAAVGEIALDEARFARRDGHRRPLVLTRVELEAAGPDTAPLEQLARRLGAECGLHRASENKFAVGLRSASLEPPRLAEPDRKSKPLQAALQASTRAGDFAAAALHRLVEEWRTHEPPARLGESAEALHALRVTGRRMDAVLSLFDAHLPAAVRKSRPTLKSLLDALGAVRDVDIRLEAAARFRSSLPESEQRALEPLLQQLESERQEARSNMLRALDAKAARHWLDALPSQLARTPAASPPSARNATALAVVPALIRKRYRKLRKRARRLTSESALRDYHKVRIGAKKLRYELELVAPTYARPASDLLSALHKLQDRLGSQHDAGAMADYLVQLAARPPAGFTPETLFMMGRMTERQTLEASRMGGRIDKPWRKVRKRWKALRPRMRQLRTAAAGQKSEANGIDQRPERSRADALGGTASPATPGS